MNGDGVALDERDVGPVLLPQPLLGEHIRDADTDENAVADLAEGQVVHRHPIGGKGPGSEVELQPIAQAIELAQRRGGFERSSAAPGRGRWL